MDQLNWFFKQRVAFSEMRDGFTKAQAADHAMMTDLFTGGFLLSAVAVVEDSPQSTSVSVGAIAGYDTLGQRVTEAAQLFSFAGDDDPALATQARLYVKFKRDEDDPRVDGLGNSINFEQNEGAELQRDLGTPGGGAPTLRVDESILLADINIPAAAGVITNADISVTGQNFKSSFPIERLANFADVDTKPAAYMGERKILTDRTVPTTRLEVEFCRCIDNTNTQLISLDNVVCNATIIGFANGLDVGALAVNTWYYLFAIADSTGANPDATLLSLGPGAPFGGPPTLPGTHDLYRRIGSVRTDGAAQFINFRQIDDQTYYEERQNVISAGVPTVATAVSLATRVPPTAERAIIRARAQLAIVSASDVLRLNDGGQAAGGAGSITTEISFGASASTYSNESQDIKMHVDGTQQIYWWSSGVNIGAGDIDVRGYIDDSKEG